MLPFVFLFLTGFCNLFLLFSFQSLTFFLSQMRNVATKNRRVSFPLRPSFVISKHLLCFRPQHRATHFILFCLNPGKPMRRAFRIQDVPNPVTRFSWPRLESKDITTIML